MEPRHDSPSATIDQDVLTFSGELVASTVGELEKIISKINIENIKIVDGSDITALDSTGAFFYKKNIRGRKNGFWFKCKVEKAVRNFHLS